MSRRKKFKLYKETKPSAPRPPSKAQPRLNEQVVAPDWLTKTDPAAPECFTPSTDGTRIVPCVSRGIVANHPSSRPPDPPTRQGE